MNPNLFICFAKKMLFVFLCFSGCVFETYASAIDNLHKVKPLYAVAINDYYKYHPEDIDYLDIDKIVAEGTKATFSITTFKWGKKINWKKSQELDFIQFCDFINSLKEGNIVFTNEGYYETMINLENRLKNSKCNIIFNIAFDYDINRNRAITPTRLNIVSLNLEKKELVVNYEFFQFNDESSIENYIEHRLKELKGAIFVQQEGYRVAPQQTFNERFSYYKYILIFHCGCHILPKTLKKILMNSYRFPRKIVRSTKLLLTSESDYFTIDIL